MENERGTEVMENKLAWKSDKGKNLHKQWPRKKAAEERYNGKNGHNKVRVDGTEWKLNTTKNNLRKKLIKKTGLKV